MDTRDLRQADWRKSTYSANGSTCVEVARNVRGVVAVRDSKNPEGPKLVFSPVQWQAFATGIRAGELRLA